MNSTKRFIPRLLSIALALLLVLTAAAPTFAATGEAVVNDKQENLTITIKNNQGLPEMKEGQFTAYQLFTGTPNKESIEPGANDWEAKNWNNYTLADIEWGKNIEGEDLLAGLKLTGSMQTEWPGFFDAEGKNIITTYLATDTNKLDSAADLAAFLVDKPNSFLQEFSRFVVEGSVNGAKGDGLLIKPGTDSTVTYDATKPEDDESSIKVDVPGYYLIVENGVHEEADAVSEYILAVLGDQVINLKASVPTVDKDIVVGIDDKKGDAAGVGDYVQFKLTGTLPKNFADFDSYKYIFHDILSKGLKLTRDAEHPLEVRVYANQEDANADVMHNGGVLINETKTGEEKNYTVSEEGKETPTPCNLEVSFEDLKTLSNDGASTIEVTADSVFVVTYYAKVTEDAVLLSDGNPNTVFLEYSNDPNHDGTGKTKEEKVYVYAFGLDLTKVGNDTEHASGLEGAGFLLKDKDGNYAIFKDQWALTANDYTSQTFYDTKEQADEANDGNGTVTAVRRLTGWTDETTTATVTGLIEAYDNAKTDFDKASNTDREEPNGTAYKALKAAYDALASYLLESGADGAIPDVYGLDAGEYSLEEVIVPDGYNTPKEDFAFSITVNIDSEGILQSIQYKHGDETITYNKVDGDDNQIAHFNLGLVQDEIENQKAPLLPFTGGVGTVIFYVVGAALIVGAILYLVIASKKRRKTENNA